MSAPLPFPMPLCEAPAVPLPPALSASCCRELVTAFLTGQMPVALRTTEYPQPDWDEASEALDGVATARVRIRHVPGSPDCEYRIDAYGESLRMRLQLNVWRFVIIYTVPAGDLVDASAVAPRFARWQAGAGHAGWTIGWRDAVDPFVHDRRLVETYCYAMLQRDFLVDPMAQLFWSTDIVQMTRAFILEAKRAGVALGARDSVKNALP